MGTRRLLTAAASGPFRVHRAARVVARHARRAMSLVETLVAIVILGTALIGWASSWRSSPMPPRCRRCSNGTRPRDRPHRLRRALADVRVDGFHGAIENIGIDSTVYKRQTWVQHIGGGATDTMDYRTITVAVTLPTVTTPVRKTVIVAAF